MDRLIRMGIFFCVCVPVVLSQWSPGQPRVTVVDPRMKGAEYQAMDGPPFGRVPGNGGNVSPQPRPTGRAQTRPQGRLQSRTRPAAQRPVPRGNTNTNMGTEYIAKDGPPFGNVPQQSGPRRPQGTQRRKPLPGSDRTRSENGLPMFRSTDRDRPIFVNRPMLRNESPNRGNEDGRRLEGQRRDRGRFSQRQRGDPRQRYGQRKANGSPYRRYTPPQVSRNPGRQHSHSVVAFSGSLKTSQYYYRNSPVIFDKVLTNIGGGYSYKNGLFTAPSAGVYMINYHAAAQPQGTIPAAVDLVVNQLIVNSAVGQGLTGSLSNSAVLALKPHDRVYLQGRAGTAIYCDKAHAYCSFNIVLISSGNC